MHQGHKIGEIIGGLFKRWYGAMVLNLQKTWKTLIGVGSSKVEARFWNIVLNVMNLKKIWIEVGMVESMALN